MTAPQVHIEIAAANLGTTPYWLRLSLRAIGIAVSDYVAHDHLRALADSNRAASKAAQRLHAGQRKNGRGSRISWRSHLSAMRSRDDLSGPRVRPPLSDEGRKEIETDLLPGKPVERARAEQAKLKAMLPRPEGVHAAAAAQALQDRIYAAAFARLANSGGS
jgi:hypothetical protein